MLVLLLACSEAMHVDALSDDLLLEAIDFCKGQIRLAVYIKHILPPFQIVVGLTFSTLSVITRLIQKFMQNVTSFVVACFINKRSFRMT